jgi:hypothetical protein
VHEVVELVDQNEDVHGLKLSFGAFGPRLYSRSAIQS